MEKPLYCYFSVLIFIAPNITVSFGLTGFYFYLQDIFGTNAIKSVLATEDQDTCPAIPRGLL